MNITHNGNTYINVTAESAAELGIPVDIIAAARAAEHQAEVRRLCADKINGVYPTYKQLNLLRSGTKAEKDKMDTFINACRDWSNGENPDPAALEAIQP